MLVLVPVLGVVDGSPTCQTRKSAQTSKYLSTQLPTLKTTAQDGDGCDRYEPACKEMSAGRWGASMTLGSCTVGKCEQVGGRHNETCRYLLAAYLPNRKLIAASQMGK